ELEEIVKGRYTKEPIIEEIKEDDAPEVQTSTMEDNLSTEEPKEEVQVEKISEQVDKTGGEQTVQIQEAGSTIEESVPEGVPVLSLHRQYEQEVKEIRTDVEAPREMNGQTVYFDEDHHPIMDSIDERQETEQPSLFTPEEYSLWTQEVTRVNKEIKEAPTTQVQTVQKHPENKVGKENKETHSTVTPGRKTKRKGNNKTASPSYLEPSLFDFMNEAEERKPQPITEVKKEFDASPRPFLSLPDSHLRDGSIVVQKGQVGFLSDLKRHPTFNPMDLPYAQLSRLKSYIEIRECYHRLYDYEAENHAEDKEDRSRLNHLYDDYVARWGYFNQKANTDIIKMDATGVEMLFLERSENGRYVKADIFDHPTAFSTTELTVAADPMEALGASLNKYGKVELHYMSSLLPDMEESDIISSLEGRIYYNPE
ncbi:MAG: helicase, partial [Prevotella buccalis]|nr:helicase [Hoylesella buccalis]